MAPRKIRGKQKGEKRKKKKRDEKFKPLLRLIDHHLLTICIHYFIIRFWTNILLIWPSTVCPVVLDIAVNLPDDSQITLKVGFIPSWLPAYHIS